MSHAQGFCYEVTPNRLFGPCRVSSAVAISTLNVQFGEGGRQRHPTATVGRAGGVRGVLGVVAGFGSLGDARRRETPKSTW